MSDRSASAVSSARAPRRRPGGRTARGGAAVLTATLELLAEGGYAAMTVEEVAERAGVHKTTVYRRWGSREGLVAAALAAQGSANVPVPDTGTLRDDLIAVATSVARNLESPLGRALAQTIVGQADDPQIQQVADEFRQGRFADTAEVVARAINRGELPQGSDARQLVELSVAPVWFRSVVTRRPVDAAWIRTVVDAALAVAGPQDVHTTTAQG